MRQMYSEAFDLEDEVDAAIATESCLEELIEAAGEDDLVDTNVDYSDDDMDSDKVEADANEYIAAERELVTNPFEGDDEIDAAIDGDTIESTESFADDDDDLDQYMDMDISADELADE